MKIFFKFSESIREGRIYELELLRRPEIVLVSVWLVPKRSSAKGGKSIKELVEPSVYDDLVVLNGTMQTSSVLKRK